jgi:hypothetical protein
MDSVVGRLRLRRRQQTPPGDLHVASRELFSVGKERMGEKDFRIIYGTEHMRFEAFEIRLLIPMLHIGTSWGHETRAAETENVV